jgi:hypothetical protein
MSLLSRIELDRLSPLRLWEALDPETRLTAARALYKRDWGEPGTKREADLTIAAAMRFRDSAVRQLPVDRRAQHLAKVRIQTESLASSLLMALHLGDRKAMLEAFLDALGVPNKDGLIDEGYELEPLSDERAETAASTLFERFPAGEVEAYLASLVAMDPDTWGSLTPVLAARKGA